MADGKNTRAQIPALGPPTSAAADEISKIIDNPVALTGVVLRDETRLTQRWQHGAIHDHLAGMNRHVVITFYGTPGEIAWRSGNSRIQSRTRPGACVRRCGG